MAIKKHNHNCYQIKSQNSHGKKVISPAYILYLYCSMPHLVRIIGYESIVKSESTQLTFNTML
jgi:hypothetical protein